MSEELLCRRCLLDEWNNAELFRTIEEYILSIPDDKRASPALTAQRLDICKSCDDLLNGMCRHCGCYVQVRAAKLDAHCAKGTQYW